MPLGRRATDLLWQFLCPFSTRIPHKSPTGIGYLKPKLQLRQIRAQSFSPTRPRIRPHSLLQLQSVDHQPQRCAHWNPHLVAQHLREQGRMREIDFTSAYQELRRLALKGDYTHIRICVRILVKERGQKPNLRLYDALLLANTNAQYGSAGEVARILDEIAAEGLVPDSATYHAALRVGEPSRMGHICAGLHLTGSCNTSRLSFEAIYTPRTAPTMVFFDQGRLARCDRGPGQRATSGART